jgi:hypothetical protein
MTVKRCWSCGRLLRITEFGRIDGGKGRADLCRACQQNQAAVAATEKLNS